MIPALVPDSCANVWTRTYRPIKYIDSYIRCMHLNGASDEECDMILAKNNSYVDAYPSVKQTMASNKTYTPISKGPGDIKVSLRVKKDGCVKLTIHNPYDKLLRHTENCKPVPIESFIQFHKLNGAPDEYLIRILENHDKRMRSKEKDDAKFMAVFEKYTSKSSSTKKQISVVKKLNPVF